MTELNKKNIGMFVDSQKISGGAFHELSSFIKSVEEYNKDFKLTIDEQEEDLDNIHNIDDMNILIIIDKYM